MSKHTFVGKALGAVGGAVGAAVGSVIPGVGTAIGAGVGAALGSGISAAEQVHALNRAADRQYQAQLSAQEQQYQLQQQRYQYYVDKVLPLKQQAAALASQEAYSAAMANAASAQSAIAEIMAEAQAAVNEIAEQTREQKDAVLRQERLKKGTLMAYYASHGVEFVGTPMMVLVDQMNEYAKSYDNLNRTMENRINAIRTKASVAAGRYAQMAANYARQAQYSLLAGQLKQKQLLVEAELYKPVKPIAPPKPHHISTFGAFMGGALTSSVTGYMTKGLTSLLTPSTYTTVSPMIGGYSTMGGGVGNTNSWGLGSAWAV